jgi:hypothetical protein
MAFKRISVIEQDNSGRNKKFKDNTTGETMSLSRFVQKIKQGNYPNYHTRKINGIDTPVSNPDKSENNNLD